MQVQALQEHVRGPQAHHMNQSWVPTRQVPVKLPEYWTVVIHVLRVAAAGGGAAAVWRKPGKEVVVLCRKFRLF